MSRETRERRAQETLKVTVHTRPGFPQPIRPQSIELTDEVYQVVWQCEDLERGATLLIAFPEDPRGPFFVLEFAGSRVTGYGNRGPADTARAYDYEARVETDGVVRSLGAATLRNAATSIVPYEPQPGPIWNAQLTTTEPEPNPRPEDEDEEEEKKNPDDQKD